MFKAEIFFNRFFFNVEKNLFSALILLNKRQDVRLYAKALRRNLIKIYWGVVKVYKSQME